MAAAGILNIIYNANLLIIYITNFIIGLKGCETGISSNILKTEKNRRLLDLAFDMKEFAE